MLVNKIFFIYLNCLLLVLKLLSFKLDSLSNIQIENGCKNLGIIPNVSFAAILYNQLHSSVQWDQHYIDSLNFDKAQLLISIKEIELSSELNKLMNIFLNSFFMGFYESLSSWDENNFEFCLMQDQMNHPSL